MKNGFLHFSEANKRRKQVSESTEEDIGTESKGKLKHIIFKAAPTKTLFRNHIGKTQKLKSYYHYIKAVENKNKIETTNDQTFD